MDTERIDSLAGVLNALTAYRAASPLDSNADAQYQLITNLTLELIGKSLAEDQQYEIRASERREDTHKAWMASMAAVRARFEPADAAREDKAPAAERP